jgi:energy-coupling factor transport system permease protein
VLARNGRRLAEAQRARPGGGVSRLALVRAVAAGALDRAVDVAATLEVRGYGAAPAAARGGAAPWSRHDLAFAVAAAAIALGVLGARIAGVAGFEAYPELSVPAGTAELVLCLALLAVALLPFADRRGIER